VLPGQSHRTCKAAVVDECSDSEMPLRSLEISHETRDRSSESAMSSQRLNAEVRVTMIKYAYYESADSNPNHSLFA
jgi:hypothetical protein